MAARGTRSELDFVVRVMARPLASLRTRVFAATALVAVLPIASGPRFVTRRVTQEAEAELSAASGGGAPRGAVPRRAARDRDGAGLARGRPAEAQGRGREGDPPHRRARGARLPRAGALGRPRGDRPRGPDPRLARGGRRRPGRTSPRPFRVERRAAPRDGRRPDRPRRRGAGDPRPPAWASPSTTPSRPASRAHRQPVAVAMEGRVFASTLPRRHDAALLAAAGGTGVARVDLDGEEHVALRRPLGRGRDGARSSSSCGRARRRCARSARCAPPSRVAALVAVGLGAAPELRRGAHRDPAARRPHRRDEGDGGDRRPGAAHRARAAVGRRGRPPLGADLRHPHRLDRPLPARGHPARAPLRPRPPVHGHRPRGPQPADDHQGLAPHACSATGCGGGGPRGGGRHRPRGGAPRPHRGRRPRLRPAPAPGAGAGRRARRSRGTRRGPPSRARTAPGRASRSSRPAGTSSPTASGCGPSWST